MKFRLALTSIVLLGLSFGIYYIAQWLASDGLDVASRQLIPMFAALLATGLIWAIWNIDLKFNLRPDKDSDSINDNLEKKKRDRLDSVLRDLSDEDLIRLKKRLTDGTLNDEVLYEKMLGEDGELLNERR